MKCVIIAGMPASGKTTFAKQVRDRLGLPMLEKDELKEILFDTVGFSCYAQKRQLDHAANAILLELMAKMMETEKPFIVVNNFSENGAELLEQLLKKYGYEPLTVFFGGNADVFYERYVRRDNNHERHLGHIVQEHYPLLDGESGDYEMTREEFAEKFEKRGMSEFRLSGRRIEVDAATPGGFDPEQLLARVEEALL